MGKRIPIPKAAAAGLMRAVEKVAKKGDDLGGLPRPRLDSRGRVIPPGVERMPSGRLPANFEFAGRQFPMERLSPELRAKYPSGVRFTDDGYPDFRPYTARTARFDPPGFTGDRGVDAPHAFSNAGIGKKEISQWDEYTWHHHQDGHTMQLVPTDLHDAVRHGGGVARKKGG